MKLKNIILNIVIVLITIMGTMYVSSLTEEESINAKTCTSDGKTAIFVKFSDTEQTGYWFDNNGYLQQTQCIEGKWMDTIEWAKQNEIRIEDIRLENNLVPDTKDEMGREIIDISKESPIIIVESNKEIVIEDKIINIAYKPSPKEIHCICELDRPCTNEECKTI